MNCFRDYALEALSNRGDMTTKQIWESLPPAGRRDMTRLDVDQALDAMAEDGLVVPVRRHWRKVAL